jgi:CRP-like cAMP-binding protein
MTVKTGSEQETRKRQVLGRSPVFAALTTEVLAEVVRKSALVRFVRRRSIYEAGEPAQAVYVGAAGRIRIVRRGAEDSLLTLAYRGPGELVGESSFADDSVHRDTAIAHDQVEAVKVPYRLVGKLLEANAPFAVRMLSLVNARRRASEVRVEALLTRTVESRVISFLLDAADSYGIPESRGTLVGVKFTHQEMASYVGSTRETVTLTLGDLKRRHLITFDHRRMVLLDSDSLKKLAV